MGLSARPVRPATRARALASRIDRLGIHAQQRQGLLPSRSNASRSMTARRSSTGSSSLPRRRYPVAIDPMDFIARFAVLEPRTCVHLNRYHGVDALNFKHSQRIVASQQAAREPIAPRPPPQAGFSGSSASSISTSNTVAVRRASSRASRCPRASRGSSLISPRARPAASTTHAPLEYERKPNSAAVFAIPD